MDLKDKVVLITGATRGIGAACAVAFAAAGAKLVLHGRTTLGPAVQAALDQRGADYQFLTADMADPTAVAQLADDAWAAYGHLDVLINNAGMVKDKLFTGMQLTDFDQVIDVDLRGPFVLMQALMKRFNHQRSGVIINLASVVGLHGNLGQANYAAAKAGLVGLTKTVAREGARRGVRANAIAPGMIASDMTKALSDRVQESLKAQVPLKRFGQPAEVASAALFLAQNDYVTGQVVVVDGGMTI